jgi:undecaprenyl-diphosphatase
MDTQLFFLINRTLANPFFDVLMPALTFQGYLLAGPLLVYLVYRGLKQKNGPGRTCLPQAISAIGIAFVSVLLADHLGDELKHFIARSRPCQVLEGVRVIVSCPHTFSLPSSHAVTSFAFATPLFLLTRPFASAGWRLYPLLLAALIALSRPYLGVHYPSDILAGAVIGAGVAGAICWVYLKIGRQGKTNANK